MHLPSPVNDLYCRSAFQTFGVSRKFVHRKDVPSSPRVPSMVRFPLPSPTWRPLNLFPSREITVNHWATLGHGLFVTTAFPSHLVPTANQRSTGSLAGVTRAGSNLAEST